MYARSFNFRPFPLKLPGMRRAFAALGIAAMFLGLIPLRAARAEEDVNPHFLLADADMTNAEAMSRQDIQTFLGRGFLGSYITADVDGTLRPAADIVYRAALRYRISPRFLLVLLQREQSLVESQSPSQKQLDWAMGYGVCDDCRMDDPGIQKFRGFANQVNGAAERIRSNYLPTLEATGKTESGFGPGIASGIDGEVIIPENHATAVLYTYTPHLHGNANFVRIWRRWFTGDYPTGTVLKDESSGIVWLIQNGKRRAIRSMAALMSRSGGRTPILVRPEVLESYDVGAPISFPNYSLLLSPRGMVYLLVDDSLRWIDSMETFRAVGFNTDDIVATTDEDLLAFSQGTPITAETLHPQGVLVRDPVTGGIYQVEDGVKHPIFSREILQSRFAGWEVKNPTPQEISQYVQGDPVKFSDGTLVAAHGSPDVFVVSGGHRRHVADESTFLALGYRWTDIVWTTERAVLEHPLSGPVTSSAADIVTDESPVMTAGL